MRSRRGTPTRRSHDWQQRRDQLTICESALSSKTIRVVVGEAYGCTDVIKCSCKTRATPLAWSPPRTLFPPQSLAKSPTTTGNNKHGRRDDCPLGVLAVHSWLSKSDPIHRLDPWRQILLQASWGNSLLEAIFCGMPPSAMICRNGSYKVVSYTIGRLEDLIDSRYLDLALSSWNVRRVIYDTVC